MSIVDKIVRLTPQEKMEGKICEILSNFLKSYKDLKNGEVITDISHAKDGVAYVILNLEYNYSASKAIIETCDDRSREFKRFPKEFATKHLSKEFGSELLDLIDVANECLSVCSIKNFKEEFGEEDSIQILEDNPTKFKMKDIEELNKIVQILDKPVKDSIKVLVDMGYVSYLDDMDSDDFSYMYYINFLVPIGPVSENNLITEEEYDNIPRGGGGQW